MTVTTHTPQPLRMAGRKAQPRLCSCGQPWPCSVTGTPVTCPPSAVRDMIVCWDEVREGDLALHRGVLRPVSAAYLHHRPRIGERVHVEFRDLQHEPFWFERDRLTAVRRYDTGTGG